MEEHMEQDIYKELEQLREEITLLRQANEQILDLFKSHVKSMALSEKMKRTGEENPRYKTELDTSVLIKEYTENGFHITNKMKKHYKEKYNISYGGMRCRLIKAGVWRENQNGGIT